MEINHLDNLIKESIQLELNMASLYEVFSGISPNDQEFWWQLHLEEMSHANLIRSSRDSFSKRDNVPFNLLAGSIKELKQTNDQIAGHIKHYVANQPSRREACEIAFALENTAGDIHYSQFINEDAQRPEENIFQQLNRKDRDHEQRICTYLDGLPSNA